MRLTRVMTGFLLVVLWSAAPPVHAQVGQTFRGTVRDGDSRPIPNADVSVVGTRFQASTNDSGTFRIDSIPPGKYRIVVRAVGFTPHRSALAIAAAEPTEIEVFLKGVVVTLPTIIVGGTRTGLYGVVGDTGYHPALGARVEVLNAGKITETDSLGRFSFPELKGGDYPVMVSLPGFTTRRFFVSIPHGKGKEVSVFLTRSPGFRESRLVAQAYEDLGSRLAFTLRKDRLGEDDLARLSNISLCDIARLRNEVRGHPLISVIVNGTDIIRGDPIILCSWQTDEVSLVEFGASPCVDRSGTIGLLLGVECQPGGRGTRSISGAPSIRQMTPYVVIWEKR